jgi:hypothetical protein
MIGRWKLEVLVVALPTGRGSVTVSILEGGGSAPYRSRFGNCLDTGRWKLEVLVVALPAGRGSVTVSILEGGGSAPFRSRFGMELSG